MDIGLVHKMSHRSLRTFLIYLAFLLVHFTACATSDEKILLWKENFHHVSTIAFLDLALSKVDHPYAHSPWKPVDYSNRTNAFQALIEGDDLSVLISAIGSNGSNALTRLSIPLDRGLLGIRLCLIDGRFQDKFRNLNTLRDMRENGIVFLQGERWPDVDILRANGAKVKTFAQGDDVEAMMQRNRPYCFSRSLAEIEQQLRQYPNLVLEESIAIVYPLADIVYVSNKANEFAELLQTGLERAVEDGSYYDLFESMYGNVFEDYQFYGRKLFFFQHPNISEEDKQLLNKYGVTSYLYAN